MLKTELNTCDNTTTVVLEGKLDANTAAELKERLDEIPDEVSGLNLDIEKLAYTSSAGLRLIIQYNNLMKQRGGKLTILHPNELISELFKDTGLLKHLNVIN